MAITPDITAGVKAIKISKVDALGNDQTIQLRETDVLRIKFDDIGIEEFIITSIAEYSTYYLYYVVPKILGTVNSNLFLVTSLSGSSGGAAMVGGNIDIYNSAVASDYLVFTAVTNRSPYIYNSGKFQTPPSSSYSTVLNFSTKVWGTGSNGNSTNFFVGVYSTGSSGENLLTSKVVNLTNCSGSANAQPVSMSLTFSPPPSSSWGVKVGSYFSGVETYVSGALTTISFDSFITSSTDINGNEVVPEPYTVYNVQTNDYNAIINNAVENRVNEFYMDVDFSTDAIIAVNEESILNGSAVRAQVQYSNYTTARITNPRYDGSRSTSPGFNLTPTIGGYSSEEPNVEQNTQCFLYTPGGRGNSLAERSGSGNYLIGFAIDENGDIYKPTSNTGSLYLPIMYNSFAAGTPVILSKVGSGATNDTNQETYPVYKPLVNSQTVLRSDTGSLDQTYLVNGFLSSISMSLVPGLNTNIRAAADGGNLTSLSVGVETTASNFGTVTSNQANAFTASSGVYKYPNQGYSPLRASITASVVYDVSALGVPPNTTVTMRIYENNNVIATRSQTATQGSTTNIFAGVSASILLSPGDTYYATISTNNLDLDFFQTDFNLFPFTGSNGTGFFGTPYFTTGSNSRNVLTASAGMTSLYGGNWQQQDTLINGTSSGFSNIQPFIVNPLDEIRFNGNESQVYLISASSYSAVDDRVYFHLNNNIPPTSGINLNYFAIRRWIFSLDNLLINTPGTIMGQGFIIPFNSSPEFKAKIDTIAKQLQKDGLIQ